MLLEYGGQNSVAMKRAHDIKQMERNHLIQ